MRQTQTPSRTQADELFWVGGTCTKPVTLTSSHVAVDWGVVVVERDPAVWVSAAAAADGADDVSLPTRICLACVQELSVDGAALSLTTVGSLRTIVGVTDGAAMRLEELEVTVGEGPGVEAVTSGGPVLVSDLATVAASRWPLFAGVAAAMQMRAIFAFPLQLGTIGLGVLTLYRRAAGGLDAEEFTAVLRAADAIALLIVGTDGHTLTHDFDERWLDRLGWSREIHQATGMLTVQLGIGAEEAFARLRAHAFARDRPLSEVAHEVVARRLVLADEDP